MRSFALVAAVLMAATALAGKRRELTILVVADPASAVDCNAAAGALAHEMGELARESGGTALQRVSAADAEAALSSDVKALAKRHKTSGRFLIAVVSGRCGEGPQADWPACDVTAQVELRDARGVLLDSARVSAGGTRRGRDAALLEAVKVLTSREASTLKRLVTPREAG